MSPAAAAATRRHTFVTGAVPVLADRVGGPTAHFSVPQRLPARVDMLADEGRLLVAVDAGERQGDVDRALAWGLAYQGDRDLILVLPDGTMQPTLRRLPWIATPVRVFTYGPDLDPRPAIVPARVEVLATHDHLALRGGDQHDLKELAQRVAPLVAFADDHWALAPAHRASYLAWNCNGRQVLRLRRAGNTVKVVAGVAYSKPLPHQHAPLRCEVTELTAADRARVEAKVTAAIRDRLTGDDAGHAEHGFQAALAAAGPAALGLDRMWREYPAWRGPEMPGFIDFLGVDAAGHLHAVETKLGNDEMLVLQALDYWTWLSARRAAVARDRRLTAATAALPVQIDLVVGAPPGHGHPLGPYTAPQLEALDGSIRWRVHVVSSWQGEQLKVTPIPPRRLPVPPMVHSSPVTGPRLAARLDGQLRAAAGLTADDSPIQADLSTVALPAALSAFQAIDERGQLHGYVRHVRSSQAFALNLFAPLMPRAVRDVLNVLGMAAVDADPAEFEYRDPANRLGEGRPDRPHQTQVDVVLRGRDEVGRRLLALVEVKLSELDFGACSAYQDQGNEHRDVCRSAGPFGDDPTVCWQLGNLGGTSRRTYDRFLDLGSLRQPAGARDSGGCLFRNGGNQPMRNIALARCLHQSGEADEVAFALCAPATHATIWRRWGETVTAFAGQPVPALRNLPAEHVSLRHPDRGRALSIRYPFLSTPPT